MTGTLGNSSQSNKSLENTKDDELLYYLYFS